FTDLCVSRVSLFNGQLLPVGMLTALTGGPLLILLARFLYPAELRMHQGELLYYASVSHLTLATLSKMVHPGG
ncbi:hypothetical protein ACSMD5_20780, partial [Raoultella ornithinolytica]|uniref:hypothetical protein n=1 Tax=Raoultella ornithinolytica TaxID=54291 RepID=UPI003F197442